MSHEFGADNNNTQSVFSLDRKYLAKLRLKARRSGAWFRDLKHIERKLLDLTINVVERVRSFILAKLVYQLINRLNETLESLIVHLIQSEGPKIARRFSKIAESWGNQTAWCWVKDRGFHQFLVINNLDVLRWVFY